MVVMACPRAAETTSREEAAGTWLRWKYHWDTVAAVVLRWTPEMMDKVQMYIRTKYAPSHQLDALMINLASLLEKLPPKNTLVNMRSQTQVHTTTTARHPMPIRTRAEFAARIRLENSRIPTADCSACRPL
jgi:hypothetical protein